ncbi:OmpA family protein [Wenyingzhuangia sp. IMCC45533]
MKNIIYASLVLLSLSALSQKRKVSTNYKLRNYKIDTLSINTDQSDFGVNYIGDKEVVFSSPQKDKLFMRKWRENDQGYLELYKGRLGSDGAIVDVEKFSKDINSRYHEAELTFTKDGKYVYFTSNNHVDNKGIKGEDGYNNLQLYKADVIDGEFKNVRLLPFNSENYSTGHPYLSADDKTLYFVSDRPGGFGGTDLYKVPVLEENTYGEITNLGERINSSGKEMFPFLDMDDVLYFSSDRIGTKGGLDVYGISLSDESDYIFQLPSPINTINDDFAFVLGKGSYGFLSSNREGGKGDDDIYKLQVGCLQRLVGTVVNSKDQLGIDKASVYVYQNNKLLDSIFTDNQGKFTSNINVLCSNNYVVKASKANFKKDSLNLDTPSLRLFENKVSLSLTPYFIDNKINIEPIYFDFDKWNIRPDAAIILDGVVATMKKYPNIVVEGGSHTDSRGKDKYNEKLSAKRAKATVDYIISKGISPDRISSKGYGENQLVNKCSNGVKCSNEAHQLNRRTEFTVIQKEQE